LTTPQQLDAVVIGRCGVDIYPLQVGVGLEDVTSFGKFLGGTAANVAVATARLGRRVALISGVGDDPFGRFVSRELARLGVDNSYLITDPAHSTPVTFCEMFPPDDFLQYFYRKPTAPDWQLSPDDFDAEEVATTRILYATGTGLAQSPSRETTLAALRTHRGTTIFDLDWRPALWERPDEYPELAAEACAAADIVIGNEEEVEAAHVKAATVVVKRGERGATVYERDEETDVPGFPVDVVNGLGAGDAFAAAVGQSLLQKLPLVEAVRRGTVAGALVASRLACSEAMPRLEELEAALV